jgi:hypothetical protein
MAKLAPREITPLAAYDPESQGSLGIVDYMEFGVFAAACNQGRADVLKTWKRLADLSAYASGLNRPVVGRLTPGREAGLEPFMFGPSEEIVTSQASTLTHAHMALDGLYNYMSHPKKIVIHGFGPGSRSVVHSFLNHRID